MISRCARDGSVAHLPPLPWWQRHAIDLVALVLGVAANVRVWVGFFAVGELSFAILLIVAAGCDVVRRIVDAGRAGVRPRLFTSDRRFDLIAALFLMTGPDPITLPAVGFLSPSVWWGALVVPRSVALGSGVGLVAATILLTSNPAQRSRLTAVRRIRDLAGVPDLHIASLVVVPDVRPA
jgi:hypothetical protein